MKKRNSFTIYMAFLPASFILVGTLSAQDRMEGESVFNQRCAACHTIGRGRLVGPDLKGVTVRREEAWLKRQIKTPDVMIAEKDPIVLELLKESNNIQMVPLGLNDGQVDAVIAYLKSAEQKQNVSTGLPGQYFPTILISAAVMIGFTWVGLRAGRKKVDVR